jgi:transposase
MSYKREPPTMSVTVIGLDTAKSFFQVHAVDEAGKVVIRRKLRRTELVSFFEMQEGCTVVIEACGAAHHWARMLIGLGHDVKLIAPEAVRPFVKKGKKNDVADAAAICEAASRPDAKFVPTKGVEQQAILSLHSVRVLLIKQRTMLVNAIRGLATEFGMVVPKGVSKVKDLLELVNADDALPPQAQQAIRELSDQCDSLGEGIETFEAEIVHHARNNELARRLATIPGVGPLSASLIAATVSDISLFESARHFAAWLGLVPRQNSTGGKNRLGRITKAGNSELRRMLVLGATSMVFRAKNWNSSLGRWTRSALLRRPVRLVTVALANKIARIAWAVMTRNDVYRPTGRVTTPAEAVG